jgi:hypothetical protein
MARIDPNWRRIPGFDGMYEVSVMGEVRSWRSKGGGRAEKPTMLKPYVKKTKAHGSPSRWPYVKLQDETGKRKFLAVHWLMRDVWMKGKRPNMVVWHRNGDLTDCCLSNLEYINRKALGKKTGHKAGRMAVLKVNQEGEVVACYRSAREAARQNYVSYQTVLDRCHNKTKNPFWLDGYSYVFDNT